MHVWCRATADAVFPKEAAKLEQVAGAAGGGVKQATPATPRPALPMLEAAPACVLDIPREPDQAEVWACIRCARMPLLGPC
jgi:hypothetical protein